ncbi:COQ9 family protein [Paracoccus alkanivorans]|uniref:COQ9 family protein n=1 Tax=Paracoccus alkanivorans TaxID=2116655 RepID=A0A3M0MCV5_9RHOB|nr:COQ9 family protein [Paracoccus alkanivorans]RMC35588.1 COQ9 family protein [Paracoccus alkanivorans]
MQTDRETLLNAALDHVPFEGMNDRALLAGAADIEMPESLAHVHFPQGGAGLAAAYHRRADAELREWLTVTRPEGRFRDRITAAVWHRLSLVQPELVRAGAATLALPGNAALGARLLWETADVIWSGLGDNSEDANWYSKRATLSAVIGTTVLFWLGDDSDHHMKTRDFLDRRIDGVMRFEKAKASLRKVPGAVAFGDLAFGWIRAPRRRNLPGKMQTR